MKLFVWKLAVALFAVVTGDMADLVRGTHTEIQLANYETSLLGLVSNLIDHSKKYTADAAFWERNFQEVNNIYKRN